MSDNNYAVIFDGTLITGAEPASVQRKLAALFKLQAAQIERLFTGKPVTIKRGLTAATAHKLVEAFGTAGAVAKAIRLGATTEAQSAEALTSNNLAKHFAGNFERHRPALTYRLGLGATALFMLLLPLIYMALVAASASAPFWYFSHVPFPHRPSPYAWLFYFMPLVAAIAIFFFLIKPLFAPRVLQRLPVQLSPAKEPLFFAYVHAIADKVGAPRPRTIEVDCQVNAAAGYYRGFHGLLHNRLTLVVGLPLVAGMNTRQLAGVLAHEFGHFSQRGGMFATYLVRRINYWFYRAVHERDQWDERLATWASGENSLSLLARVAGWGVALVRRILAAFLWCAEVTSYYMLRQMEFDADSYEARLAGSAQFRETSLRLRHLAFAFHAAHDDLGELWTRRQLVDDFPSMVARKAGELSKVVLERIEEEMLQVHQDVFATHPPDDARVAKAEALKAAGVFTLERPVHELLKQYDALARQASLRFYRSDLGLQVKEEQLVSKETMSSAVAIAKQQDQALNDYFRGLFLSYRFTPPPEVSRYLALEDQSRKEKLNEVVGKIRQALPDIERLRAEFERISDQLVPAYARQVLGQQKPALVQAMAQEISSRDFSALQQELGAVKTRLAQLDALLLDRLGMALAGASKSSSFGPAEQNQLQLVLKAAQVIHGLQNARDDLFLQGGVLFYALQADQIVREQSSGAESLPDSFFDFWRKNSNNVIDNITSALECVRYPFERAGGHASVSAHMRERLQHKRDTYYDQYQYIGPFIYELQSQYTLIMRFLAEIALRYEAHLGVPPLSIRLTGTRN